MINGVEWKGRGGDEDTASSASLMRDGQSGLYLITNQQSFEIFGGGCVLHVVHFDKPGACVAAH